MLYDAWYIFGNGNEAVHAPIFIILQSNYRELLSHANNPLILQVSSANNYLYTMITSIPIQEVHFSSCYSLYLPCSHALLHSVYLDKLLLVGDAHPQGNDKYPQRMDSLSSNTHLKDSSHPRGKTSTLFLAFSFTVSYSFSLKTFKTCLFLHLCLYTFLTFTTYRKHFSALSSSLSLTLGPKSQFEGLDIQTIMDPWS